MHSVAVVAGTPFAAGHEELAGDGFEYPREDDLERDARFSDDTVDRDRSGPHRLVRESLDQGP